MNLQNTPPLPTPMLDAARAPARHAAAAGAATDAELKLLAKAYAQRVRPLRALGIATL